MSKYKEPKPIRDTLAFIFSVVVGVIVVFNDEVTLLVNTTISQINTDLQKLKKVFLIPEIPPIDPIELLFYLLMFYLFIKYHGIVLGNYKCSIRLFPLSFKVQVARSITNVNKVDSKMVTYLKSNRSASVTYLATLNKSQTSLIIQLERRRWLFPLLPWEVDRQLRGLLMVWQLQSIPVPPNRTSLKYQKQNWVVIKEELPYFDGLVNSLLSLSELGISIKSEVKFKKTKKEKQVPDAYEKRSQKKEWQTDRYEKVDYFSVSMKVGVNKHNASMMPMVQSVLNSHAERMAVRSWVFPFQKSRLAPASEVWKVLQLPQLPNLTYKPPLISFAPETTKKPEYIIGQAIVNSAPVMPTGISGRDFLKSGIITGAIGNGKTTLRLHILQFLLQKGTRIIDFDLKGDAPRYEDIAKYGKIIIPKVNLQLDLFAAPPGILRQEYAEILTRTFIEVLPDHEGLTPPQKNLLTDAISLTVAKSGNAHTFFTNILILAHKSKQFSDNFQDATAQALLSKLGWLQSLIGDVFWTDESSLTEDDFQTQSLFFDLSELAQRAPIATVRFVIDVILTRVLLISRHITGNQTRQYPELLISIDEAQLLMPVTRSNDLTRLEEIVTTMRYKGMSVLAAGVSAEIMSQVLLDTGFLAQYNSESIHLGRSLGLDREESETINQLKPYHAIVKSRSTGNRPVLANINVFSQKQLSQDDYIVQANSHSRSRSYLPSFQLDNSLQIRSRFLAFLPEILEMNVKHRDLLIRQSHSILNDYRLSIHYMLDNHTIEKTVDFVDYLVETNVATIHLSENELVHREFLFVSILEFLVDYLTSDKGSNKVQRIVKNAEQIIIALRSYVNNRDCILAVPNLDITDFQRALYQTFHHSL